MGCEICGHIERNNDRNYGYTTVDDRKLQGYGDITLCSECETKIHFERANENKIEVKYFRKRKWTEVDRDEISDLEGRTNEWDECGDEYKRIRMVRVTDDDGTIYKVNLKECYDFKDYWDTWFPFIPNKKFFSLINQKYQRKLNHLKSWKREFDVLEKKNDQKKKNEKLLKNRLVIALKCQKFTTVSITYSQ